MKEANLSYFKLTMTNLMKNQLAFLIISFFEYSLVFIHLFQTDFFFIRSYKLYSEYEHEIIALKISPIYHLHYAFKTEEGKCHYQFYMNIIIIAIVIPIHLVLIFKGELKNRCLNMIIANYNELFLNRFFSLVIFDIFANQIVYYSSFEKLNASHCILMIFYSICFAYFAISIMYQLMTFYSLIPQAIPHSFHYVSKEFDLWLLIIKVFISFNINLIEYDEDNNILLFWNIIIILLLISGALLFGYYMAFKATMFYYQILLNKEKIFFIYCCTYQHLVVVVFGNINEVIFYFVIGLGYCLILLCVLSYSPLSNALSHLDINKSCEAVHLMTYIINEKKEEYKMILNQKLRMHYVFCKTCYLCKEVGKEIEEDFFIPLKTYYKLFLKNVRTMHNRERYSFEYDMFTLLIKMKQQRGFNFKLHSFFKKAINRYLLGNQFTQSINIQMLYLIYCQESHLEESSHFTIIVKIDFLKREFEIIIKSILLKLTSSINRPDEFIELANHLHKIKSKQNKKFLSNRENMQYYSVVLMRFIYEEILSKPINKFEGHLIREKNYSEDYLNYHYNNDYILIISVSMSKNTFVITKIGHNLIDFVNKDISQLFPKEFMKEGKSIFQNILNTKNANNIFEFIVKEKKDSQDFFYFKYSFSLSPGLNEDDITIIGEYIIVKEPIIITFQAINMNEVEKEQEALDELFNSRRSFYNANKIIQEKLNPQEIICAMTSNIYHLVHKDTRNIVKHPHKSNNSLFKLGKKGQFASSNLNISLNILFQGNSQHEDISKKINEKNNDEYTLLFRFFIIKGLKRFNVYNYIKESMVQNNQTMHETCKESQINYYRIEDSSSLNTQSTFSLIAQREKTSKEKNRLNNKNQIKIYQSKFNKLTLIIVIFCVMLLIFSIISLFVEFSLNSNVIKIYNIYTNIKATNRLYYSIITGFISTMCLGEYNQSICNNFYNDHISQIVINANLTTNLFDYLIIENTFKLEEMIIRFKLVKQHIYLLDDFKITQAFNCLINYSLLTVSENRKSFSSENRQLPFVTAVELFLNSIQIIDKADYTSKPIYIVSIDTNDYSNIYSIDSIEQWQIEYYTCIKNYQTFILTWKSIQKMLYEHFISMLIYFDTVTTIFMSIAFIFHVSLSCELMFNLYSFIKFFQVEMNTIISKIHNQDCRTFYYNKYSTLNCFTLLYDQNPLSLIKQLEKNNQEYNLKEKTTMKSSSIRSSIYSINNNKRNDSANILLNQSSTPISSLNSTNQPYYFTLRMFYSIVNIYFKLLIGVFFYYLLLFIIFIIIWKEEIFKTQILFNLIDKVSIAETSGYIDFILMQLMILGNTTLERISINFNDSSLTFLIDDLSDSMLIFYQTDKILNAYKQLDIPILTKQINLTCQSFYYNINDTKMFNISKLYSNANYIDNIIGLCSYIDFFKVPNENAIYESLYYNLQQMITIIKQSSYEIMLNYIYNSKFLGIIDVELFMFRPLVTWNNESVFKQMINDLTQRETNVVILYMICNLLSEIILFAILFGFFFRKLQQKNKDLTLLHSAFKIT